MKTKNKIIKERPELARNEDLETISDDIDLYTGIKVVADTEGGKKLIETIKEDVATQVSKLVNDYKKATRDDLVSSIAQIEARIDFLNVIRNAKRNLEGAKVALEKLLES